MRALSYNKFGGRDVMTLSEIHEPDAPKAGEVKVSVGAASINPVDGKIRRSELKFLAGSKFPKRPGLDFAGTVLSIGKDVTGLAVGDKVYGGARNLNEGAFAEKILVKRSAIAKAPSGLDDVTAAGIPIVAIAALQTLRDIAKVSSGQRVLVNGCTGGVGLFALQMAKRMAAHVTGVCGKAGFDLAREFGADDVIDYRAAGQAGTNGKFEAILELSGKLPFPAAAGLLTDTGVYVDFSPNPSSLIGGNIANLFRRKKHAFALTAPKSSDLEQIARLIASGELKPAPVRAFALQDFAEAFAVAEGGGVMGKIVVKMSA